MLIALQPITDDDADRIYICLKMLADHSPVITRIIKEDCRNSLSGLLQVKLKEEKENEV